jgi:hypothetical protein
MRFELPRTARRALLLAAVALAALARPDAAAAQTRSAARVGLELAAVNAVGAVTLAGADQLLGSPEAWARDGRGFGRRLGVRSVQFATSALAEVGLAAWRDESLVYRPCTCRGWSERLGHAALEAVLVGRADGSRGFAWPIAIGAVVGGAASAPLLPAEERVAWTLTRPVTTLLMRGVLNVLREVSR